VSGAAVEWAARLADPDTAAVAELWADPETPARVLAECPERVIAFLVGGESQWPLVLRALINPRVPAGVRAKVVRGLSAWRRRALVDELLDQPLPVWIRLADVLTPAALARLVDVLNRPSATQAWLACNPGKGLEDRASAEGVLRAFTTARDARLRALAAEAFPLVAAARHQYGAGSVSAVRFSVDPEPAVRRGLARNQTVRDLPEDIPGLDVRYRLLTDPDPTVRAAAVRNSVHLIRSDMFRAVAVRAALGPQPAMVATDARPGEPTPTELASVVPTLVVSDPLDDPDPRVRAAAVNTLGPKELDRWQRIVDDPDARVRVAAAVNGWHMPPAVWRALARDAEVKVRRVVVRSRWVRPELLRMMTGDSMPEIAAAAAARVLR
jgi:hypothetical protein